MRRKFAASAKGRKKERQWKA